MNNIDQIALAPPSALEANRRSSACLFNLIVYSPSEEKSRHLEEVVRMVSERFPCRILFIKVSARATKNALSSRAITTPFPCLMMEASGSCVELIPHALLPYLAPDFPLFLLWGDTVTDNNVFRRLGHLSNRVIFDADSTEDLRSFSNQVLKYLSHDTVEVSDLTWARLKRWRNGLALLFDSPSSAGQLEATTTLEIDYNNHQVDNFCLHNSFPALYYQAWIASRANWKPLTYKQEKSLSILTYTNGPRKVVVSLKPEASQGLRSGALLRVKLNTFDNHFFSLERADSSNQLILHASTLTSCDLPLTIPASKQENGSPFFKQLFYETISNHYLGMLEVLSKTNFQGGSPA